MEQNKEYSEFVWKGQRRYRCCRTWESGHQCEYDTHDLHALMEHIRSSHSRMAHIDDKKRQQPAPPSRIVDPTGAPVSSDPAIQRAQFKP